MKSWYQSKTVLVQLIAGLAMIIAQFSPEVAKLLTENFSELGMGWIVINLVLRFVTKDKIQIG
jgi:hypothetical protein